MSKKRAKSGGGSAGAGNKWEAGLLAAPFEDETWRPEIVMLVGSSLDDFNNLDVLDDVINSGVRRLFSLVSKKELFDLVRDLGNPKSKKTKDTPAHYEVCEPCKVYLDSNEDMPLNLLAKLIKFKLLSVKQNDLNRKAMEKKMILERKKEEEAKAAGDKDKGKKGDKKDRGKSAGKKGKKTPEPASAKQGSKLRKRGEVDDSDKYIDDEPDDGADHYVLIHGFNYPHLIGQLAELGITVNCIIKIESESYDRFAPPPPSQIPEDGQQPEKDEKTVTKKSLSAKKDMPSRLSRVSVRSTKMVAEEEARLQKEKDTKELSLFWKDILPILRSGSSKILEDVARLQYVVSDSIVPSDLTDNESKTKFGTDMFEDIACMIYDLIDYRRQYKNYLANLKLYHVPVNGEPPPAAEERSVTSAAPPAGKEEKKDKGKEKVKTVEEPVEVDDTEELPIEVDTRYYSDLMSQIPNESVSVPLIMHCMLEQVVASEQDKEPPSEKGPTQRADNLDTTLADHLSKIAFNLVLTDEERQLLAGEFSPPEPKPKPPTQPRLINQLDDISIRCEHLKEFNGFNPKEAELSMLKFLPAFKMSNFPAPSSKLAKQRAARLQELIHFCSTGGLCQSEVDRAFKQFVFECMELTQPTEDGVIRLSKTKISQPSIPWDDPYPAFMAGEEVNIEEEEQIADVVDPRSGARPGSATQPPRLGSGDLQPTPPERPPSAGKVRKSGSVGKLDRPGSGTKSDRPRTPSKSGRPGSATKAKRPSSGGKMERTGSASKSRSGSPKPVADEMVDMEIASDLAAMGGSGILKKSGGNLSRSSSVASVHFDKDAPPSPTVGEAPVDINVEETMDQVVLAQRRDLSEWCYAEHFEPNVLLQVIEKASYFYQYMDTYYHKRDHTLLVMMHNPYNRDRRNHSIWHQEMFSNVGFRNYLEHIAELIHEWTKGEEARYQAELLTKELEKIGKDEEEQAAKSRPKSGKKDRKKSASKRSSRASSKDRVTPAPEPTNIFIRPNSLKAYKLELERLRKEQEEEERIKQEKLRAKSSKGKNSPGAEDRKSKKGKKDDDDKKKKAPSRQGSARSRMSINKDQEQNQEEPPVVEMEEPFWPFHGYDTGNNLIQSSGIVTNLFPTDGGVIRMERYDFVQATVGVRMSVLKDGHTFNVHVINPKDELPKYEEEKAETEASEKKENDTPERVKTPNEFEDDVLIVPEIKADDGMDPVPEEPPKPKRPAVGSFSSFSACLSDGMSMSFSAYGDTGSAPDGQKYVPEPYLPPPPRSPSPAPKDSPAKGGKKGEKAKSEKSAPTPEPVQEEELKEEEPIEELLVEQEFQQLYVTCPDGLAVRYMLESQAGVPVTNVDERHLLVKQTYVSKTNGGQECEKARLHPAMDELSRTINGEGTVIKMMRDGSVIVLFADGTMSKMTGSCIPSMSTGAPSTTRASSAKSEVDGPSTPRRGRKGKTDKGQKTDIPDGLSEYSQRSGTWETTSAGGEKIVTKSDGSLETPERALLVAHATDPETNESMVTREDHVILVTRPDGTFIVEHQDGTRITTFYRQIQEPVDEESTNETGEVPDQLIKLVKFIRVECPGFATVEFNCDTGHSCTMFGSGSYILVSPDGSYFVSHTDGGKIDITIDGTVTYRPKPDNELDWSMVPQREHCYVIRHHEENICQTMDNEGNTYIVKYSGDTEVLTNTGDKVNEEDESRVVMYKNHAPRFFIIHSDGSGTELQRFQDIAEYLYDVEHDPYAAILKEPLQDYPGVHGITVMKPYKGGPSEKWLTKYDESNILPKGLKSRDLKTLPPVEEKKSGPVFGTDTGRGLNVGTVDKNIPKIEPPKCPSVLELRQIVEYELVSPELRSRLQGGLKNFVEFAKTRQEQTDDLLEKDARSEEEKMLASDLNDMVLQEVLSTKITSDTGDLKGLYERVTAPPAPSPPPTPQPKRSQADWDKDKRELAEEYEGRKALRHGEVPPYFKSELGKAYLLTAQILKESVAKANQQAKDVPAMLANLAEDPRTDGTQAIRGMEKSNGSARTVVTDNGTTYPMSERSTSSSPQTQTRATTRATIQSRSSPFQDQISTAITPSNLRPGNPTPAHALGQGSPAPVRPHNPTPMHAGKAGEKDVNPTPRQADTETPSSYRSPSNYPSIPEQQAIPEENQDYTIPPSADPQFGVRSLQFNAVGDPRGKAVQVPAYMSNSGRPKAQQNMKFNLTEDPVRRKVKTASIAGATVNGKRELAQQRGLELLPDNVNFGLLREGYTYGFTVFLKNTGVDLCRYTIRQPPPSTGLRVIYTPGPVAAGMKTQFVIEIYSIAAGVEGESGVGCVQHDLEVVTETNVMYLPIIAEVMTSHEFDQQMNAMQGAGAGVKLLSTKPPSSQGIIRPRKEQSPYDMIQA